MTNIITCAYKSALFAKKHVAAILKQKGDWMHYVGVDGCPETLKAYQALKHDRMRLFSIPKNHGKPFMQNSLVAVAQGHILLFDSDDYMAEGTIENLPRDPGYDVYRLQMINSDQPTAIKNATAILYMNSAVYAKMGGFRTDIKCSHDTCFNERYMKQSGRSIITLDKIPPFTRNRHPMSLTMHPDTAIGSQFRNLMRQKINRDIDNGKWVIPYEILPKLTEWI